jgi:hypothetical protein
MGLFKNHLVGSAWKSGRQDQERWSTCIIAGDSSFSCHTYLAGFIGVREGLDSQIDAGRSEWEPRDCKWSML